MPVGEVGKMLQEVCGSVRLPELIKDYYGGLKKFLECQPHVVALAADHPFNPSVVLAAGVREKLLAVAAALRP